jgi:hypothetical protein
MTEPERAGRDWRGALLIAAAGLLVVAGAWDAGFLTYDDPIHVSANPKLAPDVPIGEYFTPAPDETYFPLTLLSYRLDRRLFSGWMPQTLGSWAPGVRGMTWLYHVLAALVLWRVLGRLGLGRGARLGVALVFAVHPAACETVCWVSERKNALAGLFGFLALWLWLADGSRLWRMPLATVAYAAALLSKPSALGLLPVLVLIEVFRGGRGLRGEAEARETSDRDVLTSSASLVPALMLSGVIVGLGLRGHESFLVEPPGGTVFTALLTDAWIMLRYVLNLLVPTQLSAVYAVEPITSLAAGRLWLAILLLGALVAGTLRVAGSRRRALFGWLWFVGALGPNLNLIAIPYFMADRYLYLALPGFFIVAAEALAGLWTRQVNGTPPTPPYTKGGSATAEPAGIGLEGLQPSVEGLKPSLPGTPAGTRGARRLPWLVGAYLVLLGVLALQRGPVWRDMITLFSDAATKEPRAAFAHYGLGLAHGAAYAQLRSDPARRALAVEEYDRWMAEWEAAAACPDSRRLLALQVVALTVGRNHLARGDAERARPFLERAAEPRQGAKDDEQARAAARAELARLPP